MIDNDLLNIQLHTWTLGMQRYIIQILIDNNMVDLKDKKYKCLQSELDKIEKLVEQVAELTDLEDTQ